MLNLTLINKCIPEIESRCNRARFGEWQIESNELISKFARVPKYVIITFPSDQDLNDATLKNTMKSKN